jgi:hypothetical protein
MSAQRRPPAGSTAQRRRHARASRGSSSTGTAQAAGLAVLVAGTLLVLGYVALRSLDHTASPPPVATTTPAATTPGRDATPRIRLLPLAHFAAIHTALTLHGQAPTRGTIVVKGSYGGLHWSTLARVETKNRAYSVRIYLSRRGQLHLRVLYPDGSRAVGSVHVS